MGANLRTHWLPGVRIEQVEPAISAWLSAKGFEPVDRPANFWPHHLGGRGLVLTENDRGVAIAYSDVWTEGDRLIFELHRLAPTVLECWLHDSDLWGYRLFREGETIASFCSNPRYFGGEQHDEDAIRLGRNGDARLLTETLGFPEKEQALRDLQTTRRAFAESLTDDFADLIEAPALALDYLDWQELGAFAYPAGTRMIADHSIRAIVYVPRSLPGQRAWDLHRIPARQLSPPDPGEFVGDPAFISESMLWTIATMRALAIPIGLLMRTAALPILLILRFRPQWILGRMGGSSENADRSSFRQALWEAATEDADELSRRSSADLVPEGEAYLHVGYGVRFVPAPGVTIEPSSSYSCLLRIGEQVGMLAVSDFESTETLLGNLPGEILEDLCETTADGLPLRFVTCDLAHASEVVRAREMHRARQAEKARRTARSRGWFGSWFARRSAPSKPDPSTASSSALEGSDEPSAPPRLFLGIVQEERFVYLLNMALHERPAASAEALKATLLSLRRMAS